MREHIFWINFSQVLRRGDVQRYLDKDIVVFTTKRSQAGVFTVYSHYSIWNAIITVHVHYALNPLT